MLPGDIITLTILLFLDVTILISLFFIPISSVRGNLYGLGFTLWIISSSGILITVLVCIMFSREGWNNISSILVILVTCLPYLTLWCIRRWILTGGIILILEALVLVVFPYGFRDLCELTAFTNLIYQLFGGILALSGILLYHWWRVNPALSPWRKCRDLRKTSLILGFITLVVIIPVYISSIYTFAVNYERESAAVLLIVLLAASAGYGLNWKSPCTGGWILLVAGIMDLFILLILDFYFPWKLPLLGNITIVNMLPALSGILSILYDREKGRIYTDYMISSGKFFRK